MAANVPAAYIPCEGATDRDDCRLPGYGYGGCVLDTLCTDDVGSASPFNECLLCGDPCRGLEMGSRCLLPDASLGLCHDKPDCEDDPERSFRECGRCVPTAEDDCFIHPRHGEGVGHWDTVDDCNQAGVVQVLGSCFLCLPGPGATVDKADSGCGQGRFKTFWALLAWLPLIGLALREWRRRPLTPG